MIKTLTIKKPKTTNSHLISIDHEVLIDVDASLTIEGALIYIDGVDNNHLVESGEINWGTELEGVTLDVNGLVKSNTKLILNLDSLSQAVSTDEESRYIEVEAGGSIQIKNKRIKKVILGHHYRIKSR